MITLDQVLLLQKKVETAVEKIKGLTSEIEQLKADNDALRSKCTELTKALTDKTEFVSTLESEQDKIESTILHALNQLDIVENSILNSGSAAQDSVSGQQPDSPSENQSQEEVEEEEKVVDYSSNKGETDLIEQESEAMRSNDQAQQPGLHNAAEAYVHQSSSMERPESNEDVSLFGDEHNSADANSSEENSAEENPSEQKNSINSEFDIF